jgi:hypothetical protein
MSAATRIASALALALASLGGCSRSELRDAGHAPTQGSIHVQLSFTRIGGGLPVQFEGQAHFARYAVADSELVPTLLGLADDEAIPLDTCRAVDSARELDRALDADPAAGVELLDAGRLTVHGPRDQTALVAKHYPELTPFVTGVVYDAAESLPLALEPGALYEVEGEGGEEIAPFQAQAQAPRAFPSLDVPVYRRGGDLELRWSDAASGAEAPPEPLLLTVAWSSWSSGSTVGSRARTTAGEVRCRVRDDGSFTVPRELLETLPPANRLAAAQVSALRLRRAPLSVPGALPYSKESGGGFDRFGGALVVGLREVAPLPVSAWPAGATPFREPPSGAAPTELRPSPASRVRPSEVRR